MYNELYADLWFLSTGRELTLMILSIKNLNISFKGKNSLEVIRNFNLKVEQREKILLIGESGSGKSVVLLAIMGLLSKNARVNGSIKWRGRNLLDLPQETLEKIRGKEIAYVPQGGGNGLNPVMNINKQLTENISFSQKKSRQIFGISLLKKFHIGNEEKVIRQYPHMLSGGMKQRVMIAMGIARGAKLVLVDEPTKGLDHERVTEVIRCFQEMSDLTLLGVTHDLSFAKAIADKIIILYAATILEIGAKDCLFTKPLHPYTQALIAALPQNGLQVLSGFAPPHIKVEKQGCVFFMRCKWHMIRCRQEPPLFQCGQQKVRCWLYADAAD